MAKNSYIMKTQEPHVADDALIRQRMLSNTGGVRGLSSHMDVGVSLHQKVIAPGEIDPHVSTQKPVFPASHDNLLQDFPREMPGKVWPQGLIPYAKARIAALFDPRLSLKGRLRSLPLIGYGFGWINAFIRLPLTRYRHTVAIDVLRQQNQLLQAQLHGVNQRINQLEPYADTWINAVQHIVSLKNQEVLNCMQSLLVRIEKLEAVKIAARLHQFDNLDIGKRLMQIEQLELARKLKQFTQLMRINQIDQSREQQIYATLLHRIEALEQATDNSGIKNAGAEKPAVSGEQQELDLAKFYLDFEAQFRGSRAEIKQRQQVYLTYFDRLLAQPVDQRKLFVDVGCGRGEWLELLSEQGIPAIGIDSNASMVDACLQKGYAAKVADGIAFLQQQEKSSLAGVSGFHIIEHLPFEKLIALFDAAYDALSDDGILIFETPNPENLIIGACNFYYDPTHLKPIVPDVAQFIAKQRGFRHVEIKRLHPFPDDYQMTGESQLAQTLNKFLFSAQDYAVIARK